MRFGHLAIVEDGERRSLAQIIAIDRDTAVAQIYEYTGGGSNNPRVDWCGYLSGAPPSAPVRDVNCPDLVTCDATARWDLTDKPYLLWDDVTICPTGTLEIGPGVELRAQDIRFYAIGSLDVQGTEAAPVTFHSDAATPSPGDWSASAPS